VRACHQSLHPDVGTREVVDRRTGGLEDAEVGDGVGEDLAVHRDAEPLRDGLDPRRARVVPD
jgi:hypothetical protein